MLNRTSAGLVSVVIAVALPVCSGPQISNSPTRPSRLDPVPSSPGRVAVQSQAGGGATTIAVSMSGNLQASTQTVSGRNNSRAIVAKGPYTWTMALDLATLSCPPQGGNPPWEAGLVAFIQGNTPRQGELNIDFEKQSTGFEDVDSWTTTIGDFRYRVQIFRWKSKTLIEEVDRSIVQFRGGSTEAFKMDKKLPGFLSREQCFGEYVNYDFVASK